MYVLRHIQEYIGYIIYVCIHDHKIHAHSIYDNLVLDALI